MWLAVASTDAEEAQLLLKSHWEKGMSEEERAACNAVVDLDQDTLVCPACQASFEKAPRCPECGLNFGG